MSDSSSRARSVPDTMSGLARETPQELARRIPSREKKPQLLVNAMDSSLVVKRSAAPSGKEVSHIGEIRSVGVNETPRDGVPGLRAARRGSRRARPPGLGARGSRRNPVAAKRLVVDVYDDTSAALVRPTTEELNRGDSFRGSDSIRL